MPDSLVINHLAYAPSISSQASATTYNSWWNARSFDTISLGEGNDRRGLHNSLSYSAGSKNQNDSPWCLIIFSSLNQLIFKSPLFCIYIFQGI
ncbi:hypothetical protein I7I50_10374 [Histoplasma capsulatum G186AR]|uniref:Uncharacterized protein n=1 Tax=Ajellomyces capsulatus TaxID=5037 RepID=A0A8H7Z3Q9_AJECA|nr:hypothetical protein I7I52_01613 [Histoplasma capsulatum]QSS69176.1 hypothetical protein I7I50_10374 [Histoplasma capsulatum G186AR]